MRRTSILPLLLGLTAASAAQANDNLTAKRPVTHSGTDPTYPASLAVDENPATALSGGSTALFLPGPDGHAFMEVDIGSVRQLGDLLLWNTQDFCANPGGDCEMSEALLIVSEIPIVAADATSPRPGVSTFAFSVDNELSGSNPFSYSINRPGRYLRIWNRAEGKKLAVSELSLYEAYHAAQMRKASQSSTAGSSVAARAADGSALATSSSNSIAQTNPQTQPWWQVDLAMIKPIRQIDVRPRTDAYSFPGGTLFLSERSMSGRTYSSLNSDATVSKFTLSSGTSVKRVSVNRRGRYVRVQIGSTTSTSLALAEVQVWAFAQGGLYNASVSQSSVPTNYPNATADKAVDGNADGAIGNGSVVRTDLSPDFSPTPWWQIDLGSIQRVQTINIFNRTDCCKERLNGVWVFTSAYSPIPLNSTVADNLSYIWVSAHYLPASPNGVNYQSLLLGGGVRYIRIQKDTNEVLNFAEVELHTEQALITTPRNGQHFATPIAEALANRRGYMSPPLLAFEGYLPVYDPAGGSVQIELNECDDTANPVCLTPDFENRWRPMVSSGNADIIGTFVPWSSRPMFKWTVSARLGWPDTKWRQGGAIAFRAAWQRPGLADTFPLQPVDTDGFLTYHDGAGSGFLGRVLSEAPSPADLPNVEKPPFLSRGPVLPDAAAAGGYYARLDKLGLDLQTFTSFKARFFDGKAFTQAKYYNKGDLGLGRNMACSDAVPGYTACYVTNYSGFANSSESPPKLLPTFGNRFEGIKATFSDPPVPPIATVAMIAQRDLAEDAPDRVLFVVYNANNARVGKDVQLDFKGYNTTVPGNCLTCHNGEVIDGDIKNGVRKARFLPFDFTAVDYDTVNFPQYTRDSALEENFRKLNAMVYDMNPGQPMRDLLDGWYDGDVHVANQKQNDQYTPPDWDKSLREREFYQKVIRPICRTCHLASSQPTNNFLTPADFKILAPIITLDVCKNHQMPQAERTAYEMWHRSSRGHILNLFGIKNEQCAPLIH